MLGLVQWQPTVRLMPEAVIVKQGDPLLLRVDMTFGVLPPHYYFFEYSGLNPINGGLVVTYRRPNGRDYKIALTPNDFTNSRPERRVPTEQSRPEPAGKSDAAFIWVVRDRDQPVFDTPGDYSIKARVILQDRQGVVREIDSPPVTIRVEPTPPLVAKAVAEVQPVLNDSLSSGGYYASDAGANTLKRATGLDGSQAASATRQVLSLYALAKSPPGEPRRDALAQCERVRGTLSPVARSAFNFVYAENLLGCQEFDRGLKLIEGLPSGPRKLSLRMDYDQVMSQRH